MAQLKWLTPIALALALLASLGRESQWSDVLPCHTDSECVMLNAHIDERMNRCDK